MRTQRLVSRTVGIANPGQWCCISKDVPPRPRKRRIEGRRKSGVPLFGRTIPQAFFDLLKACADEDQNLRFVQERLEHDRIQYAELLKLANKDDGKLDRLRAGTIASAADQSRVKSANYENRLMRRKGVLQKGQGVLPRVIRRRKLAFNKLYRAAQTKLNRPGLHFTGYTLPEEALEFLQDILDTRSADAKHQTKAADIRRRFLGLVESLKDAQANNDDAGIASLTEQKRKVSQEFTEARFETQVRKEYMAGIEHEFVNMIWEYVASDARMFERLRHNVSNVSRGENHVNMDEDMPPEVANIPSSRDDLIRARDTAYDLLVAKFARYERLANRYYKDLEAYLKESSDHNRLEFDKQFFKDRAQAMKEMEIVERRMDHFKDRLKNEGKRRLADYTSDFGTMDDDGRVHSTGVADTRDRRRQQEIERPTIQGFINDLPPTEKDFVQASVPPVYPTFEHDSDWEAETVRVGDFDTYSRTEDAHLGQKLRNWRSTMDDLRKNMRLSRAARDGSRMINNHYAPPSHYH